MNIFTAWSYYRRFANVQKEVQKMPTQAGKPWYTSLTVVTNVALTLLTAFTPEITQFIAAHPRIAVVIAAVTNILLRFRTDKPVS